MCSQCQMYPEEHKGAELEGATAPLLEASARPVGGNFWFLLEETWQNDVRKLHFEPFQFPCLKVQPLCWKIPSTTPAMCFDTLQNKLLKIMPH